jgi:hypothetical protein
VFPEAFHGLPFFGAEGTFFLFCHCHHLFSPTAITAAQIQDAIPCFMAIFFSKIPEDGLRLNKLSKMLPLTASDRKEVLETALSWIVVLGMFIYGFGKLVQFGGASEFDKPVSELSGMELMWAFYGYSFPFAVVLGVLEVSGGVLIFFRKTRLLGCFFTSTILINVILQDIFYGVHLGALKAALLYQFILFYLLWAHRKRVFSAIHQLLIPRVRSASLSGFWLKAVLAFLLFIGLRVLEYYLTIKW